MYLTGYIYGCYLPPYRYRLTIDVTLRLVGPGQVFYYFSAMDINPLFYDTVIKNIYKNKNTLKFEGDVNIILAEI